MSMFDNLQALVQANDPELQEYIHRARRDVLTMLGGNSPQEDERFTPDYGPWTPPMMRLLGVFEQEGDVQKELAEMLHEDDVNAEILLKGAVTSDDRPWKEVLEELREEIEEEEEKIAAAERRAAAESRMRERLARTTGDSMADEIMAMLREQDLSRTDIYRRYSRNVSAERINDALFVLERLGWACWQMVSSGGGRPREVWFLPLDEE